MIEDIRSAVSRILVSSEARGLDFSPACPDELGRELRTELDVMEPDVMEPDVMEPKVMEPDSTEPDRKSTLGVYAGGSSPFTPFHWSFVTVFLSLCIQKNSAHCSTISGWRGV